MASTSGARRIPIDEFFLAPKHNTLAPDELIVAVHVPRATGPQVFSKVGPRSAMVIAVCSLALAVHPGERRIRTGIGSAGPTPLRAAAAEEFVAASVDWSSRAPLDDAVIRRFADLVCAAARPIDDVRGSAAYRTHALGVLARRTLSWCWDDYRRLG